MRYLASVALSTMFVCASAQAATRILEPPDIFKMQWASDPQIRADGAQIAYVRTANDIMTDGQIESLWLIDTATGAQTPLAGTPGHYSSPRWSPDGQKIAYLSTGADGLTQIVVQWMHGRTAVLTRLQEAPSDITWSPDSKQIAFVMLKPVAGPTLGKPLARPAGAKWAEGPVVIDQLNFQADGQGLDKPGYRHVYVVAVDGGGEPRQLTFGPFSDGGPLSWSPDGRWIYFAGNHNAEWKREPEDWARHTAMTLNIFRVGVADGNLTQLSHEVGPYNAPAASPNGKLIVFLGYKDLHIGNQDVRLNVMNADGGHPHLVGESLDRSITKCQWATDGRSLYIEYVDHGVTKVAQMGLDGRVKPIASGLAQVVSPTQLPYSGGGFTASSKGAVAYAGGGPDHLPEIYLAMGGKVERLTDLNSELLSSVTLGKLEALRVKSSFDGRAIDAWELLPPNYEPGKKYPLILEIHGGPYGSYGPTFSADFQFYASAGYIVVYGNPRGSTSYGEEFANLIYNDYPSQDYDDLMSIVDAAIRRSDVDAHNLFVTGSSGGGVLTAWIVGKTHRFRAAVVQRPVVNWTSWLLTSDMGAFAARYWFRHMPWDDQETYWKHSPLSLVGNVTTPTLVVVGLKDLRTTVGEARQYYQALQLRHISTELYEIPGAAHGLVHPSQIAEQSAAIVEWFNRHRSGASH
jgi:dipeptidyl aminopeptidase/acylaminoacyl peptidase